MLKMPCKVGPKRGQNTKYTKGVSKFHRPLMKHEEGVKIGPVSVRTKVQNQRHNELINHANMGIKEGDIDKWHMEVPNSKKGSK